MDMASPRRAALDHLDALLRLAPKPVWATPALVALGLAASLAETLGITLIVAFVYSAMGSSEQAAYASVGVLGRCWRTRTACSARLPAWRWPSCC